MDFSVPVNGMSTGFDIEWGRSWDRHHLRRLSVSLILGPRPSTFDIGWGRRTVSDRSVTDRSVIDSLAGGGRRLKMVRIFEISRWAKMVIMVWSMANIGSDLHLANGRGEVLSRPSLQRSLSAKECCSLRALSIWGWFVVGGMIAHMF